MPYGLYLKGLSLRKIGSALGVTKESIKRWLKDQREAAFDQRMSSASDGELTKPSDISHKISQAGWRLGPLQRKTGWLTWISSGLVKTPRRTTEPHKAGSTRSACAGSHPEEHAKKVAQSAGGVVGVQRAKSSGRISVRKYSAVLGFYRLSGVPVDGLTMALSLRMYEACRQQLTGSSST